jgi:YVTN family beta-propeller protein
VQRHVSPFVFGSEDIMITFGTLASRAGGARRTAEAVGFAVLLAATFVVPASAATVASTWNARIGTAGSNGTVRVQAYTTGTGALTLKLVKLRRSSLLPVVISKGTCSATGTVVATLASIRTSSAGAATRTSSLTAAHIKAITAATKSNGKIVIRIGSGTARKCGQLTLAAAAAVVPAVTATIPVGVEPSQVVIDPTGVWVTNWYDNTISRIDPLSNAVLSVSALDIPATSAPEGIASGFGSIWVTVVAYDDQAMPTLPGSVVRVNPATGTAIGTPIAVGRWPLSIAVSPEGIWVANTADGTVSRIDPLTNSVTATIPVGNSPVAIVGGFGSVWVSNDSDGKVARIDPATNQVSATIQTQAAAFGLTVGAGSVWVTYCGCNGSEGIVSRIDPLTNSVVAAVPVGLNPGFVSYGGAYVWVAVDGDTSLVQIDPSTNSVRKRIPVGAKSFGIAASSHAVWVVHPDAVGADPLAAVPGTVTRITF